MRREIGAIDGFIMKKIDYACQSSNIATKLGKGRTGTWYSCDVGPFGFELRHVAHDSIELARAACDGETMYQWSY